MCVLSCGIVPFFVLLCHVVLFHRVSMFLDFLLMLCFATCRWIVFCPFFHHRFSIVFKMFSSGSRSCAVSLASWGGEGKHVYRFFSGCETWKPSFQVAQPEKNLRTRFRGLGVAQPHQPATEVGIRLPMQSDIRHSLQVNKKGCLKKACMRLSLPAHLSSLYKSV